jgi:XTP/dITP diphosphohydrolase
LVLYLASTNRGKLREFSEAADQGISVQPLPDIEDLPRCLEDGATFEQNAREKARHYSAYAEGPVFADDSGICVDALGGAPGVYSARFAAFETVGPSFGGSTPPAGAIAVSSTTAGRSQAVSARNVNAANNARLLRELQGVPPERRTAHYLCAIVLAQSGRVLKVTEGRADGVLLETPRGSGGFGYDPYFYYPPLRKTFAELSPEEKHAVSHRGQAFRKLLDYLRTVPSA